MFVARAILLKQQFTDSRPIPCIESSSVGDIISFLVRNPYTFQAFQAIAWEVPQNQPLSNFPALVIHNQS
jgi:hypothetical protein